MLFSWPCVLVGLTWKWFEVKIRNGLKWKFSLQTISKLMHKERERDHTQIMPWTQSPEPFDFAPFNFTVQLRLRIAPRSHPSTSPMNPEPKIARLRLRQLSTLLLRRSTSTSNRTLRLCRWTQSRGSHAFDFTDFTPFDFADFAHLRLHQDRTPISHRLHWDRNWEMVGVGTIFASKAKG